MNPLPTLTGTDFLLGYAAALVAANLWAAARWRRHRRDVSSTVPTTVEDPFEIAFLAGGARQTAQLAAVRLIAIGAVEWISKWTGPRLIAVTPCPPSPPLSSLEASILSLVQGRGTKGMPANQFVQAVAPLLRPIEVRLATLGLRPTGAERSSAAFAAVWPLGLLAIIGIGRIMVGLGRDRPVGFLIAGVFFTVVLAILWGTRGRILTPAGGELLDRLRARHRDRRHMHLSEPENHLPEISLGVALFGPAAVAGIPGFQTIHQELRNHIGTQASSSAGDSGGGGCSSGCGGGCGGCGGCGD